MVSWKVLQDPVFPLYIFELPFLGCPGIVNETLL